LTAESRKILNRLRDIPDEEESGWVNEGSFTYQDVLNGTVPIDISHAGGELADMERGLTEFLDGQRKIKRKDTRNRWNVLQLRVQGFRRQMEAMVDAYVKWSIIQGDLGMEAGPPVPLDDMVQKEYKVKVIDILSTYTIYVPMLTTDKYTASCLVGQGLIPCSPWNPKLAVSIRVLELFRLARLRCPALGVQSWIKTLSDLHGAAFKPYTAQQFTTCFDLYLEILNNIDDRVKKALGRDTKDWRLKNCCPACTYKLEGEEKLIFDMLCTYDGNDSLKRILRKDKGVNEDGVANRGGSERPDPRTAGAGGDYFLTREEVDRWSKERLAEQVKMPRSADPKKDSECRERWKNMSEELTARMWGIFDETGVFLALCRHGFVLLVADMVRSGELAKYGLAISNTMLDAFGPDLGQGYDIGCDFETTIQNSPLGPKAAALNLKMLVGAFHGHGHNRRCQLDFLTTYVEGLGIEDLEGCERLFSKTNALARSTRYASAFHRKQSIKTYLAHVDTFDTYANLSTFLINNYKQAIAILDTKEALDYAMEQAGVTAETLASRLEEEREYLDKLSKEPQEETDQMEYYQQLVNL
ncbi:hypothetical protein GGX14DRAFT_305777, partial [Mycena pura]